MVKTVLERGYEFTKRGKGYAKGGMRGHLRTGSTFLPAPADSVDVPISSVNNKNPNLITRRWGSDLSLFTAPKKAGWIFPFCFLSFKLTDAEPLRSAGSGCFAPAALTA